MKIIKYVSGLSLIAISGCEVFSALNGIIPEDKDKTDTADISRAIVIASASSSLSVAINPNSFDESAYFVPALEEKGKSLHPTFFCGVKPSRLDHCLFEIHKHIRYRGTLRVKR